MYGLLDVFLSFANKINIVLLKKSLFENLYIYIFIFPSIKIILNVLLAGLFTKGTCNILN